MEKAIWAGQAETEPARLRLIAIWAGQAETEPARLRGEAIWAGQAEAFKREDIFGSKKLKKPNK